MNNNKKAIPALKFYIKINQYNDKLVLFVALQTHAKL